MSSNKTADTAGKSRLNRAATFVVRKVWMLFAISIVLIALFMSLLRYSLPLLNEHKEFVENYVSAQYAIDIDIGELAATWQQNGPTIVLRDVTIQRGSQSPLSLQAGEILLDIDFWPSVASGKLQSEQVLLNQVDLEIDITRIETSDSEFPIVDALENVFLEQLSNFEVSNSRVNLISAQNNQDIDIVKLFWINEGNHHQGVGDFALEDFSDNSASFILDLYGDADSYSGSLYARANDIDLTAWINEFTGLEQKLATSKGNIEAWGQISNGKITRIDGEVLPSVLEWEHEQSSLRNIVQASFSAVSAESNWYFAVDDLSLITNEQVINTSLNGSFSEQAGFTARMQQSVSLAALRPLMSLYSLSFADQLALTNADGNLDEFVFHHGNLGPSIKASVNNIKWQNYRNVVGFDELQADIYWRGDKGRVLVQTDQAKLLAKHYFERSLSTNSLYVPIDIVIDDSLQLSVNSARTEIDGLDIDIDLAYSKQSEFLSLFVNINEFALNKVPSVLPSHLLGEDTKDFLARAFKDKGRVKSAQLIWHGSLQNFPFENNEGVFQSNVTVTDADFVFSSDWPALSELDIDLLFENRSLTMKSESSKLDRIALSNLTATIPSLDNNALLTINAQGSGTDTEVTGLMLKSSMADTLGTLLERDLMIDGQLDTRLSLFIPLSDGNKTRAVGEVNIAGNNIYIPSVDLQLTDARGSVGFDNAKIKIQGLQANLWDQALILNAGGDYLDNQYKAQVDVSGEWEVLPFAQKVNEDFAAFFEGTFAWDLGLSLAFLPDSFNYEASLTSGLEGLKTKLPIPFNKLRPQTMPFIAKASGDSTASLLEIQLADLAKFDGALPHQEKRFNRAHLALGPTEFETRGLGFSISANLQDMHLSKWYAFIQSLGNTPTESQNSLIGLPKRIFIDSEKVHIAGQQFSNVDVRVRRLDNQWEFDVNANEVRGSFNLHDDLYSKGVVADFEYITLGKTSMQDANIESVDIDPSKLPSINFTCKACQFDDLALGRIEVEAQPNNDGLQITQLLIDNGEGSVRSSGQWYKRNADHYTFLGGELNSGDFGKFLSQMGLDSGIQDSRADMSFALTWQGSPVEGDFANLDGNIDWALTDGYLTEVSDQGSRIFTILSLNSLVRKLSLDFRDVFAKGFFYDSMKGSVQITQGKADTRDTFIDGAAGEIEIYGYTDLASKALNYNVSFTPNVTGNLPVLVYFFTVSPPSALAALAIDQMLTSAKVISNVNYSVTGTINEPIMTETGRESTDVDLPARRQDTPDTDELPPFIPPSADDLIEIEVKGDQS